MNQIVFGMLLFLGCAHLPTSKDQPASGIATNQIVETYHPASTQIGYDLLNHGGNAFDAFIGATAADYVLGEGMTSIGGPIGILVYDRRTGKTEYLNAAFNDPLDRRHRWNENEPTAGSAALGPGAVAGLEALSKKYGKLPLRTVLQPAIDLAETGFPLTTHDGDILSMQASMKKLRRTAYGRETFFKDGKPLLAGDVLKLPALAAFLRKLGDEGSSFAYSGEWAKKALAVVNEAGGHLTLADFSSYRSRWESSLSATYKGYELFFPRTAGGIVSTTALKIVEPYDLGRFGKHYTDSAEGLAFVDRAYIEASLRPQNAEMPSPAEIENLRAKQNKNSPNPDRGEHSLQVTIVDREGNAVTGTHTIEGMAWGEGLFVDGVLLSSANELPLAPTLPGQRRAFSLAMHVVTKDKQVRFISGTFNSSLIPAEYQFLLNLINYGMTPEEAVNAPRFGARAWSFDTLKPRGGQWLDPRISRGLVDELSERGLKFKQSQPVDTGLGAVAVVGPAGVAGAVAPLSRTEERKLVGIGAVLKVLSDGRIAVARIIAHSPADEAGLLPGDIIVSVQKDAGGSTGSDPRDGRSRGHRFDPGFKGFGSRTHAQKNFGRDEGPNADSPGNDRARALLILIVLSSIHPGVPAAEQKGIR